MVFHVRDGVGLTAGQPQFREGSGRDEIGRRWGIPMLDTYFNASTRETETTFARNSCEYDDVP